MKKQIAIFASGSGSNAERMVEHFQSNDDITVSLMLTNNPEAGIIKRCRRLGIPIIVFGKKSFKESSQIVDLLKAQSIDLIVLAGFLWLIPENLVKAFPDRIINIHPALLPKYGGKGMWGHHVHEAVLANNETESGITIHLVNEHYDEGKPLFQASVDISACNNATEIAAKVLELEHANFSKVVEVYLRRLA